MPPTLTFARIRTRAFASVLLLAPTTHPVNGAQERATPKPVFGVETTLVAVPVFVLDKSGKAVPGLRASDFEIRDQGSPVSIAAFEAIEAGEPMPLPPKWATASVVQTAAPRQFVFLFDLQFAKPAGLMRARDAAARFVEASMNTSDLAAVATFDRSGLKFLTSLTPDRAYLNRAISRLGLVHTEAFDTDVLGLGGDAPSPSGGSSDSLGVSAADMASGFEAKRDREGLQGFWDYRQRSVDFVAQLDHLARLLGVLHGRKQVVLFSAGFDPETWRVRFWDTNEDVAIRARMDELFKELAAADVVIHSLDVSGLESGMSVKEGAQARSPGQQTLAAFALNSGGRFIKDTSDIGDGLRQVLDTSRYYYVLGFQPAPSGKAGNGLRSLKVRVLREGLSVSHRSGYRLSGADVTRDPAARRWQAAEAVAKGLTGGPLELRVEAIAYLGTDHVPFVPAVLEIDGRALATRAAGPELKLEIYGYAMAGGRILDGFALSPTLDLRKVADRVQSKGLQVITTFAAIEGPVDLRFFVRDAGSGLWGSARYRLHVPAFAADELVASPPLVVDDPASRIVIPFASRGRPQLEIPFRLGETRFVPEPLPRLAAGRPREVCVLVWRGRPNPDRAPLKLSAELRSAAAAPRAVTVTRPPRVVSDADGFERYVFELVLPEGLRGRCTLRLTLEDPSTGAATASEASLELS